MHVAEKPCMSGHEFIDLFAGCGGLSLGLSQGGWRGVFAVEREPMAFETFSTNFLSPEAQVRFAWPAWLERRPWSIADLLRSHEAGLRGLRGRVRLVAGGPPCQGFSFAGRRKKHDPRNMLFRKYVEVVEAVRPDLLLVENVRGMKVAHGAKAAARKAQVGRPAEAFSLRLVRALSALDYDVLPVMLDAREFGVPQRRSRLFVLGVRRTHEHESIGGVERLAALIREARDRQCQELGLVGLVSASQAISDLETRGCELKAHEDPSSAPGFRELVYTGPRSRYQMLMHGSIPSLTMNSMRLARHSDVVLARFQKILRECRKDVSLSKSDRERFGLSKQRTVPLAPDKPAHCITTLPDDMLHYSEPRILTVRECARLQSFPDWFRFSGRYTTGGIRRVKECPRYTQVGNAVAPLVARALGLAYSQFLLESDRPACSYGSAAAG
jgi:DNA (cytosine-5)-methyltransferase 1